MKEEILEVLQSSKDFVSGQELCQRFQVSRTAVWKAIGQLKEEGYEIEAISRRGYRLVQEQDLLNQRELEAAFKDLLPKEKLLYYETIDSTNALIKRLAEKGGQHGTLAVAEEQSAGRGRRGREWYSPKAGNLYFSILLRPDFPPDKASVLTLIMALSVTQALAKNGYDNAFIKWPNDIVMNGKKICGILTEMSAEIDFIHYVVIGVGINVGDEQFSEEIQNTATTLSKETGKKIKRLDLLADVIRYFQQNYHRYEENKSFECLKEQYETYLLNRDASVKVLEPKGEFTGIARGINAEGELLVEKEDGTVVTVYAGEVSVRGIYGYV